MGIALFFSRDDNKPLGKQSLTGGFLFSLG
jgi:hypothetical protein